MRENRAGEENVKQTGGRGETSRSEGANEDEWRRREEESEEEE